MPFIMAISLLFSTSSKAQPENLVFSGRPSTFSDYGYLVRGAAWVFRPQALPIIYVCWENPTDENQQSRLWVQDQISKTWQAHTALEFRGWQKCAEKNSGIRILINDEPPHVKEFGNRIDGVKNGMILNDAFSTWSRGCQKTKEACVRAIAAHEFGHALGFAHEQNRPDTPGECSAMHGQNQKEEIPLTPYDPHSVMNYCNSKYNNDGLLSLLDIRAAQTIYGKRNQSGN